VVEVKSVFMNTQDRGAERRILQGRKGPDTGPSRPTGGKTTLMRILTGYFYPMKGTASINGHDVTGEPLVRAAYRLHARGGAAL